jgi:hypothetical protein
MSVFIVVTPSPVPSARQFYVTQSKGAFGWTPRLGEAERFLDRPSAEKALAGLQCSAEMITAARILKVGESR